MTGAPTIRAEQIVQFSPLVQDLDAALDGVHRLLRAFPSRRNRLDPTGVDIAIYPFGRDTFMELVAPFRVDSAAQRLLDRSGTGWFMLNVDIAEDAIDDIDRALEEAGVPVVTRHVGNDGTGMWHIHPQDACGVLLALYIREDRPDHTAWAGPTWRHFEPTNRRVVDSIGGASLATEDLGRAERLYSQLGFSFSEPWDDAGDQVIQADCPGGTMLQLRSPTSESAPSAEWLSRHGEGLFHLRLNVADMDVAQANFKEAGADVLRQSTDASGTSSWIRAPETLGMPIELRSAASK